MSETRGENVSRLKRADCRGTLQPRCSCGRHECPRRPYGIFIASNFVQLEILPKAQYHKQTDEVTFYEEYFGAVHLWVLTTPRLVTLAMQRAR